MPYEQILYTVAEGVATLTLNRPDKLNAWTLPMGRELEHACYAAQADPDVHVLLLTGAGRSFSAGADLSLIQAVATRASADAKIEGAATPFNLYLPKLTKPVIAALHGNCIGMGLALALYADLRLASSDTRLTTAFAKLGLVAEWGVAHILPRIVGLGRAFDLLYTARVVDADEALSLGLVNRVFAATTFAEEALAYARTLAQSTSPRSLRILRQQVYAALAETNGEAAAHADREMHESFSSEDCREGIASLLNRRPPTFTGR